MAILLTSAQMRAIEESAMAAGQADGAELMRRAGAGLLAAMGADPRPDGAPADGGRAIILCGPGNNGGDGYVLADLLRARGWAICLMQLGSPPGPDSTAGQMRARFLAAGGRQAGALDLADPGPGLAILADFAAAQPDRGFWLVDALFGIGLSRPLVGLAPLLALRAGWGARARVLAVDIVSGLCADSGRVLGAGPLLAADLTVSFHAAKCGHYLAEGPGLSGDLVIADIGLGAIAGPPQALALMGPPAPAALRKPVAGHKFSAGHVLVLGGPPGRGGAARLASRGALRIGAGLVTLACPPAALAENAARLDAVMLAPLGRRPGAAHAATRADAAAAALRDLARDPRLGALCLGPGLGRDARARALVAAALDLAPARPLVLDADALRLLGPWVDRLRPDCVLTPHRGEFAALCPDLAAQLQDLAQKGPAPSRADLVAQAARRLGAVVLLKGHDTLVAAPDGQRMLVAASYGQAAPWLATAGAGDVLAGMIAGLIARGFAPFAAACTAAWLHGAAARAFGPGLIAEDLPEALPGVLRALGV